MGIQIKIPNTNFTKYIGIVDYPIKGGLKGLFYLGGNEANSTKNHANPDTITTVDGTVQYQDTYVSFNGDNTAHLTPAYTTDIFDTSNDITVITIFRHPDVTNRRTIFGTYDPSGHTGYDVNSDIVLVGDEASESTLAHIGAINNMLDFRFTASTLQGRSLTTYIVTAGRVGVRLSITLDVDRGISTKPVRIGGAHGSYTNNGNVDISLVSYHSQALTLDEIQLIYIYLKRYYSQKGIIIL